MALLLLGAAAATGARAVLAMPAQAQLRSATPTPQPQTQPSPTPTEVGLSLDTIRALFSDDVNDRASETAFSQVLYQSALRSPLVPPLPAHALAAKAPVKDARLPTPTPQAVQPIVLASPAPVTPTAPITQLLDLPVSTAGSQKDAGAEPAADTEIVADDEAGTNIEVALVLPTPTPRPPASAVTVDPTPNGAPRSVRLPILMYHYLSVPPASADIYRQDLSVSPTLFAAHLEAMQNAGYTTISLYELMAYLTQGVPLPENPVIITFDDGYRDNYENALPLLRERNMVATFFVVTDFIDEQRPEYLTWDMAREMLAAGMKVESHGRNHVSLQGKDADYLIWQALGSSETIEYELGIRPRFVSYPAGEYDRTVADIFASAGYWAGATTVQGATHSSDAPFDLHRVRVRGTTSPEELLRLLALDW